MALTHNSKVADNEPQWSSVDKSKLPRIAYAEKGDAGKKSTWKYPHHWIENGEVGDDGIYVSGTMYLHRGGLIAAWGAANGARSGKKANRTIIDHLKAHRDKLGMASIGVIYDDQQSPFFAAAGFKRYKKDVIKEGIWRHPYWDYVIDATKDRMDKWCEKFKQMKEEGIRVPFPYDHSESSSKENAGWVDALYREGDTLYAEIEVPLKEDNERIGATVQEVSISINPNYKDGTGRDWGEVIEHISPVVGPVVTGQSNFIELSTGESREVIYLSRGGENMNKKILEELAKVLGVKELTEENVVSEITKQFSAKTGELDKLKQKIKKLEAELEPNEPEPSEEVKRLQAKLGDQIKQLQRLRAERVDSKIDMALSLGKIKADDEIKTCWRNLLLGDSIRLSSNPVMSVADAAEAILESLPDGCVLDMEERAKRFSVLPRPRDGELTEERRKELVLRNLRATGDLG